MKNLKFDDGTRIDRTMKVCVECGRIYGLWHHPSGGIDCYQKCGCKTPKPDMRLKRRSQEIWQGFDFNEVVTLCYCCGQEVLKSGSKWSVWFCEECKERVVQFNTKYQRTVIPIGRHSIMTGCQLSGKESEEENKVKEFMTNLSNLSKRIDVLEKWRTHIMLRNLKSLGYSKDITLTEYLSKVKSLPDRSMAFKEMCEFFMVELKKRDRVRRLS